MIQVNCNVSNCEHHASNSCTLKNLNIGIDGDVHAKGKRDTLCSNFSPKM